MGDIINQMNNDSTGQTEQWITIKDASDLLGISERHAWNIITSRGFQTKKLLNHHRKKTYVLRADIEQFHKAEQERQKLEALKAPTLSAISEKSEKTGEFEISESGHASLSESGLSISDKAKTIPALLRDMQTKQVELHKGIVKWRVTAFWISVLGFVLAGMLYLSLNEVKKSLSESQTYLSESQKSLSAMSERVFMISEREKGEIKDLNDKQNYIKTLEDTIKKEQGK